MSDEDEPYRDLVRRAIEADESPVPPVGQSLADVRERAGRDLVRLAEEAGLRGEPVWFGRHSYTAVREPVAREGTVRWAVHRDRSLTPVGYLTGHRCDSYGDGIGFKVYDAVMRPLFVAKAGRDDGCVPNYGSALTAFEAQVAG